MKSLPGEIAFCFWIKVCIGIIEKKMGTTINGGI